MGAWFCFITVCIFICALLYLLPGFWVGSNTCNIPLWQRNSFAVLAMLVLCAFTYSVYWQIGAGSALSEYYSQKNREIRNNHAQIRPLYSKLQRALVKNRLDLAIDLDSVDLILHFAKVHAELKDGILDADVVNLLQAVLKVQPKQISTLNLLAVDAYKREHFAEAIRYWELILLEFPEYMRESHAERVLKDKIAATRKRISLSKKAV